MRAAGGAGLVAAGVVAPLPWLGAAAAGGTGVYLLFTALAGSCLGYRLMGRSTCPVEQR